MDPAPLVRRSLEGPLQRGHQPGVLVGVDQLHPGQAASLEAEQEAAPKCFVLAVTDVEPEDLPRTVSGDPGGYHDGHRDDLAALAGLVAHMQVGRVEVHVGEPDVVQRSGPEGTDRLVELLADPRHL